MLNKKSLLAILLIASQGSLASEKAGDAANLLI